MMANESVMQTKALLQSAKSKQNPTLFQLNVRQPLLMNRDVMLCTLLALMLHSDHHIIYPV